MEFVKLIGGQILNGIKHMHDRLIIHQVLKPANIVLEADHQKAKIIDLGVSLRLE